MPRTPSTVVEKLADACAVGLIALAIILAFGLIFEWMTK